MRARYETDQASPQYLLVSVRTGYWPRQAEPKHPPALMRSRVERWPRRQTWGTPLLGYSPCWWAWEQELGAGHTRLDCSTLRHACGPDLGAGWAGPDHSSHWHNQARMVTGQATLDHNICQFTWRLELGMGQAGLRWGAHQRGQAVAPAVASWD